MGHSHHLTKNGWNYLSLEVSPSVIIANKKLPYNEEKLAEMSARLRKNKCRVFFNYSEDSTYRKIRQKVRVEVYKKYENMSFNEQVEAFEKLLEESMIEK